MIFMIVSGSRRFITAIWLSGATREFRRSAYRLFDFSSFQVSPKSYWSGRLELPPQWNVRRD